MLKMKSIRYALAGTAGVMLLLLTSPMARSQDLPISPSEHDRFVANQVQNNRRHILPLNGIGAQLRSPGFSNTGLLGPGTGNSPTAFKRYPADLQYNGGSVVQNVQQYLIYVNVGSSSSCSTIATCWGDPHAFLRDLGKSSFIHVLDQYIGKTDDGRYSVSDKPIFVNYPTTANPMTDADIMTIVHSVATSLPGTPTGYTNLYHVFLVPGQAQCSDTTYTDCYSPANVSTWVYCAYHSYADYSDIGHVLYTVEPFEDVSGSLGSCATRPGTPNGQLADSQNSALSHETFETITDPDVTAWWNNLGQAFHGQEVADECLFVIFASGVRYGDSANIILNGRPYATQLEYSNSIHACTNAP